MRGRRGLSEVLGAFIVVIAVVSASIVVSAGLGKATQRTLQALEAASESPTLLVAPAAVGSTLRVSVAPLEPGEEVTVIVADSRGTVLAEKKTIANSTVASLTLLEDYDCRPVYVIAVTGEGRVGVFHRSILGMPWNGTLDPRLYTCPAGAAAVAGAIRDPLTGAKALVAPVTLTPKSINFEPLGEKVEFVVRLLSTIRDYWGLEVGIVSAQIQVYNGTSLVTIGVVKPNEFIQVYQGQVNVSVGILYDETFDFAVIVARIDGPRDLYLVDASVSVRMQYTSTTAIPIGEPYYVAVPLVYSLAQNTTMSLYAHRDRQVGYYSYLLIANAQGYTLVGNSLVIGYALFYGGGAAAAFQVTLDILGGADYDLEGAQYKEYYVGTVAPGDPISISLESLPYKLSTPYWQDSIAAKLVEAAPVYPHTIQLILKNSNGSTKTVDVAFGSTAIVADDYYEVYLRIWETPPTTIYSSWNITITTTTQPGLLIRTWSGTPSQYPALNPTLPPWLLTIQTPQENLPIIIGYTLEPRHGAQAYLTEETPPGACALPTTPWQDPLVKWNLRTCNARGQATTIKPGPATLTLLLDGEELLEVPGYEIRILHSP